MSLLTVSEMAKRLGVDRHRVVYVLQRRRVAPFAKAGITAVYLEPTLQLVARELAEIDAKHQRAAEAKDRRAA